MFALPSIANLIISTFVFFIAVWYINRYLDEQGIPTGMTRSLLVFTLASLVSWGSGEVVDWLNGTHPAPTDLSNLLKRTN
ncbi:MAG TPA: hypothetical protein DE312_05750 [Gallionella sp.]|jgi:hypothetical protein|nr:hypothetical protein [Gallionella sp.]OGS66248.1 MAG: hypothetical protein A2Z87_07100 [Gallionellales bacterium GWA2_54_124]OGT20864.1 MAG: hypothetical protein A2522_01750 [Gallionellales bacterium RIFOXYD12_FULL_53_10]OGT24242.1 MAG: hypothetical protein A3K00_05930 [Gallionellales bacterium RIFOXYD2_FULL_52_7]HCI52809.1 hypothetical protein [Gallionella sp.]